MHCGIISRCARFNQKAYDKEAIYVYIYIYSAYMYNICTEYIVLVYIYIYIRSYLCVYGYIFSVYI